MILTNKVAIVTGGLSGIGKEIVIALLENEIKHVVILDLNENDANDVMDELMTKYGENKIIIITTDVTNEKSFTEAFQKTLIVFGRIDIVVNNVGILNEVNYEAMINVNVASTVRGINLGYQYLSKKHGGHGGVILNMSSLTAFMDMYALPIYSATKSAILQLTRNFGHSHHVKDTGVSVMALYPGYTPSTKLFCYENGLKKEHIMAMDLLAKDVKQQDADSVGRAAVHAIKYGESGSIWAVDGGHLYEVAMPTFESCAHLTKQDV